MQDLNNEPQTAKEWFNRACVETILAKVYEEHDCKWLAQPHAERAVFAVASGLKMLVAESCGAGEARLK